MKNKKFKPAKMVNWFDVKQLAATGIRSVVSGIFGNYADKREMQAALIAEMDPCDYSKDIEKEGGIWLDFISDTGDGFNSTYSVAKILAAKELPVAHKNDYMILGKSRIIVMGGDQVYPTPHGDAYNTKLIVPFETAFAGPVEKDNDAQHTHLYAIPGNHDWYDGLTSFIKLFCQKRKWGSLTTKQSRSYFAMKLTKNTWLWGTDVQLDSDIDLAQLKYFRTLGAEIQKETPGSKIILCTAEPAWIFRTHNREDSSYERLKFFESTCIEKYGLEVILTLTGDLHHYSRYSESNNGNEFNHKITSGGGGTFLHPTHFLKEQPEKLDFWGKTEKMELKAVYPDKRKSKLLAFRNLAFPFLNWQFSIFMGFIYWIMASLLQSDSLKRSSGGLKKILPELHTFSGVLMAYTRAYLISPSAIILSIILVVGIYVFTDTKTLSYRWAMVAGAINSITHFILFLIIFWAGTLLNMKLIHAFGAPLPILSEAAEFFLFVFEMVVVGGFLGGFLMGIYLLASINFIGSHITEAFSSFYCEDYKNFLRLHISSEAITIYPVGIKRVTKKWKITNSTPMNIEGDLPACHLIEDPIKIILK